MESSIVLGSNVTADHHHQIHFKRYRAAQGDVDELAMTAKKSGEDKRLHIHIEQIELTKRNMDKDCGFCEEEGRV